MAFIAGDDQLILLAKAIESSDDSIRLTAAKILSRKRGVGIELLQTLAGDSSPIVSGFAQKALTMIK